MKIRGISIKKVTRALSRSVAFLFWRGPILESPVPHLLSSNQAPTKEEIALIQEAINQTEHDLNVASQDTVSGNLPKNVSRPEKSRKALVEFKQIHEALLSPVRRIPPEILEMIFRDVPDIFFHYIPNVSQVCRYWRAVALSIPQLWANLQINFRTDYPRLDPPLSSQISLLELRLKRSQNASLSLYLATCSQGDIEHPLVQKLLDCSNRWEQASIILSGSVVPLFNRIEGNLAALTKLWLFVEGQSIPCYAFQQAPMLHHLSVRAGGENFSFPWTQLSSFEDTHKAFIDKQQKVRLLSSAKNLRISWSRDLAISTESLVVCWNLETLRISFEHDAHLHFFDSLQTPNIQEIKVDRVHADITEHLLVMIKNTPLPSTLRRLSFNYTFSNAHTLSTLLRHTGALEELEIQLPHQTDLRNFIYDPVARRVPLVPKLRKLLFITTTIDGCDSIIEQIAVSRCELTLMSKSDSQGLGQNKTLATLDSFSLKFTFSSGLTNLQGLQALERSIKSSEAPQQLLRWALDLRGALQVAEVASWRKEEINMVNNIFSSLSLYDPIDVRHLHQTGIHVLLNDVINWSYIPKKLDQKHRLRSRASSILKHWEESILLDIPNRRWCLSSDSTLRYIPQQDALRSQDPLAIVYGRGWNSKTDYRYFHTSQ